MDNNFAFPAPTTHTVVVVCSSSGVGDSLDLDAGLPQSLRNSARGFVLLISGSNSHTDSLNISVCCEELQLYNEETFHFVNVLLTVSR